jgi:hypothetical protein
MKEDNIKAFLKTSKVLGCDNIQHTRVRIGPNILTEISCRCAIKFAHGAGYDPVWSLNEHGNKHMGSIKER